MSQQTINIGAAVDDQTADTARDAFDKTNDNFTELYSHTADTSNPHSVTAAQLGLVIGTNTQAWDADLDAIAGLSSADGNFMVGSAGGWVAESGDTARTSLGVGTGDSPEFTNVNVTGLYQIDGVDFVTNKGGTGCATMGSNAGASLTTGAQNLFIGTEAGNAMTAGSNNVAIGYRAGYINDGSGVMGNTFIGNEAGSANATGIYNTIIGYSAGRLYTGNHGLYIGYKAGDTSTGGNNTLIGREAGAGLTTAVSNTIVGMYALRTGTGIQNTVLGTQAGQTTGAGVRNVYLGVEAAQNSNGGDDNQCMGFRAGESIGAGDKNVYIGTEAGQSNNGSGNVYIGYQAGQNVTTTSNRLIVANTNTSTPLIDGNFSTPSIQFNADVILNNTTTDTLGLYGITGVARAAAMTTADANTPNSGDATTDNIIANLQTRVNELQTALGATSGIGVFA